MLTSAWYLTSRAAAVHVARARPGQRGGPAGEMFTLLRMLRKRTGHLEGWDVLYNQLECYITKPVCDIPIMDM